MQYSKMIFVFSILVILFCNICNAMDCSNNPPKIIVVDKSKAAGPNIFQSIQSAINSVPTNNIQWFNIKIAPGTYSEKIQISVDRPCIILEGAGTHSTIIEWSDHQAMSTTPTFESLATNIVAMGITFKNMYNDPPKDGVSKGNVPAIAAAVKGDKTAFYKCAFKGVQDTLFDQSGRHYFYKCYIQGEVDFIFGNGQSIYEKCVINLVGGPDGPQGLGGYITAQARNSENDTSGFVFKYCTIEGVGKVFLGRAYRAYSRVIFTDSYLSPSIDPQGWSAWDYSGHEGNITFVEEGCRGAGANKSKRVPWLKHMGPNELIKFKSQSFIDRDGWIPKQPITNKDI